MSRFDRLYRRILLSKNFSNGWGNPENLKRLFEFRQLLSSRDVCKTLVEKDYPIIIDKEYESGGIRTLEGHFQSPFATYLPSIVPPEVKTARFQMILPSEWKTKLRPVCVQLAGTGDHYYWRRRNLVAKPLLKEYGIASVILENPYFPIMQEKCQTQFCHKPGEVLEFTRRAIHHWATFVRSCLMNVSDLFVMGGALILESLALFHWLEGQGLGPLGVTGISMGGHMASLAATNWHKPISLIPCLSWSTASCVFTKGVLSGSIPWDVLQTQYNEDSVYERELRRLFHSPEASEESAAAYHIGQQFVREYPQSLQQMQSVHAETTNSTVTNNMKTNNMHSIVNNTSQDTETTNSTLSDNTNNTHSTLNNTSQNMNNTHSSQHNTSQDTNNTHSSVTDKDNGTYYYSHDDYTQKNYNGLHESDCVRNLHENLDTLSDKSILYDQDYTNIINNNNNKPFHRNYATKTGRFNGKDILEKLHLKKSESLKDEALDFMRGVMDEFTHLGNFSVPVDPRLTVIVVAKQDAYIPRDGVFGLDSLWPGSEVRYINLGHISTFLFRQAAFRKAINDSFKRQIDLHYS